MSSVDNETFSHSNEHTDDSNEGSVGGIEINQNAEQISIISQGITEIPNNISGCETIKQLHLSYNSIEKLNNLHLFPNLHSLVVDNNILVSDQSLIPVIKSLQTLWVNNNNISDLKLFMDCISKSFPNLTYLSMLKNPACPNYFTGKDFEDYKRYRLYVMYRMKKLKFLDYSPVSDEERRESNLRGPYLLTVKADFSQMKTNLVVETNDDVSLPPSLPDTLAQEGRGAARFGISNYVYVGKHSEGNRFITDDHL